MHPSGTDYGSTGGGRPLSMTSSPDSLESLGHTINFIKNWLQCFSDNYELRTFLYNENMKELFRLITLNIPIESSGDYKRQYQMIVKVVGGYWFI